MGMVDFSLGDVGGLFTDIRRALTGEEIKDPQKVLDRLTEFETNLQNARSRVIEAEAKGESSLQRNWRPIVMIVFTFIIANNFILVPYATALTTINIPTLQIPPDMWNLITLGLTGYVMGRSGEKMMKAYKDK